ncbi:MAG: glycosyltransferase [Candidatus Eremiobacteraeota bacterium]|nr:glycosyltransferase [Candidatus Eremiobacteraeota bacterium]
MANVLFVTMGTLGDVLPLLAPASELRRRGHEIVVAAPRAFRDIVEAAGSRWVPYGSTDPEAARANAARDDFWCLETIEAQHEPFERFLDGYGVLVAAAADADLIVDAQGALIPALCAAKLGIRHQELHLNAFPTWCPSHRDCIILMQAALAREPWTGVTIPGRIVAQLGAGAVGHDADALLRCSDRLRRIGWRPASLTHAAAWATREGVREAAVRILSEAPSGDVLYTVPPAFIDRAEHGAVDPVPLGFSLTEADDGPLDRELDAFLERQPVLFSLGSMSVSEPAAFLSRYVAAARLVGVPLLVQRGWAQFRESMLDRELRDPAYVRFVDYVSHDQLLARCRAMISHGGIGALARALRNGVPSMVAPRTHDAFYNARFVTRLELGIAIRPYESAAEIAAALTQLLSATPVMTQLARWRGRIATDEAASRIADAVEHVARGERAAPMIDDEVEPRSVAAPAHQPARAILTEGESTLLAVGRLYMCKSQIPPAMLTEAMDAASR